MPGAQDPAHSGGVRRLRDAPEATASGQPSRGHSGAGGVTIAPMPPILSETTGHQRLLFGVAVGALSACLPLPLPPSTQALLAWCLGTATYLALAWRLAVVFDAERTRARAQAQDESGAVLLLVMLTAVLASVGAIAVVLQQAKDLQGWSRGLHIGLSMLALSSAWLVIHTLFAYRYAHRYYQQAEGDGPDGPGLVFPGGRDPDYFDFLYHALVVGMTSQVSDVDVTSRAMRHLTLVHSVLSFAFNMLVLALSVNVVAGAVL